MGNVTEWVNWLTHVVQVQYSLGMQNGYCCLHDG
jgi:hypothetical protein